MTVATDTCPYCRGFGFTKGGLEGPWEQLSCNPCKGTGKASMIPSVAVAADSQPQESAAVQRALKAHIRHSRIRLEQLEDAERVVLALAFGDPRVTEHESDVELTWLGRGLTVWVQGEGGYRVEYAAPHTTYRPAPLDNLEQLTDWARRTVK